MWLFTVLFFYDDRSDPQYQIDTDCLIDVLLEMTGLAAPKQLIAGPEQQAQEPQEQDVCSAETESARGNDIEGKRECG